MKVKSISALVMAIILMLACTSCATIEIHIPATNVPVFNRLLNGGNNTGNPAAPPPLEPQSQEIPLASEKPSLPTETSAQIEPVLSDNEPASSTAPTQPIKSSPDAPTQSAGPSSGIPTTKEEIVKYYCTAYNKIAKEAKTVTRTYDYVSNYNNIVSINNNKTLEGIAKMLMNKFMVENKEAWPDATAKNMPPLGKESINIDPKLISSATCTDKGTYYEVILKSTGTDKNYEKDSQPVTGSAGSFGPVLNPKDVTDAAGKYIKFKGLHTLYATASVACKIDKATGRAKEFAYLTPCVLHFDSVTAVVVTVANCDIGLYFHQNWKIDY